MAEVDGLTGPADTQDRGCDLAHLVYEQLEQEKGGNLQIQSRGVSRT